MLRSGRLQGVAALHELAHHRIQQGRVAALAEHPLQRNQQQMQQMQESMYLATEYYFSSSWHTAKTLHIQL
jgi:hypothetical protein